MRCQTLTMQLCPFVKTMVAVVGVEVLACCSTPPQVALAASTDHRAPLFPGVLDNMQHSCVTMIKTMSVILGSQDDTCARVKHSSTSCVTGACQQARHTPVNLPAIAGCRPASGLSSPPPSSVCLQVCTATRLCTAEQCGRRAVSKPIQGEHVQTYTLAMVGM